MRDQKRTSFIFPLAAILIALVITMTMTERRFFELTEEQRQDICTELDNNWHRIEFRKFSLNTPNTFKFYEQQGFDSYIGLITDGTDTLEFDFGWYSNSLTSFNRTTERFNGREAYIGYSNFRISRPSS